DLDRQRSGQRLADGDRLAHLLARQPLPLEDQLSLHLPTERDRPAEAQRAETKIIADEISDRDSTQLRRRRYSVSSRLPGGHRLARLRHIERTAHSLREVFRPADRPVVEEDDSRLLARHVLVDRDDVDARTTELLQNGLQLGFDHREVTVDERLLVR